MLDLESNAKTQIAFEADHLKGKRRAEDHAIVD